VGQVTDGIRVLESKGVGEQFCECWVNGWIDLMFGYKQRGREAVAVSNLYKEEMYDDIWKREPTMNQGRWLEIETMIDQIGPIPPQLFTMRHESRILSSPASQLENPIKVDLPVNECVFGLLNEEQ
jgi:hypothetical protein